MPKRGNSALISATSSLAYRSPPAGGLETRFARWRVAAQGDNVVDSRLLGLRQVGAQLVDRRTDAGQVRSDRQLELAS